MSVVRFDQIARECRETFKGSFEGKPIVGLEHIEPYDMLLKNYDVDVETTFTKSFKKGQILFGRRRAYQHKACVATIDGICSGDITVIEPIEGKVYPDLLPFIIQNDDFFEHAIKGSNGALSPRVKWEHMANFEFDLPPLAEQKVLAEKLWAAYEVKQSYLKMIAATEEMVKSQFIEMFGDPIKNSKSLPQKILSEVLTLLNGRAYKAPELLPEGKYLVLRVGNFFSNTEYYYSNLELEPDKYCDTGDLLYTWSTSLGAQIWNGGKVIYHYHIWKILFNEDLYNKDYLCYLLNVMTDSLKKETHGSTMVHLTKEGMEKKSIIVPPMDLQKQFSAIANQSDKSISELRKSVDAIDKVIKSLINENL